MDEKSPITQTESLGFGQRVRTTVDRAHCYAPAGSFGTVIYPLDEWGDIGIALDGDSSGGIHAYGADELTVITDVPEWLAPHI